MNPDERTESQRIADINRDLERRLTAFELTVLIVGFLGFVLPVAYLLYSSIPPTWK